MRRPAPGRTRGVLTLVLGVLLALAGPLTGSSAAAARSARPIDSDRTAQVGRHADHDAVAGGSTRLSSSRVRTAAPRAPLPLGAAVLPTTPTPAARPAGHSLTGAVATTALPAPSGGTLGRAPPA